MLLLHTCFFSNYLCAAQKCMLLILLATLSYFSDKSIFLMLLCVVLLEMVCFVTYEINDRSK